MAALSNFSAPFFEGATYTWFGPAGFSTKTYNPIINPVTLLNAGAYFVTIKLDNCTSITSANTIVYVNEKPNTPHNYQQ